jgi:predicted ATP-grasp superfamily ATP-dependent carboligase
VRRRTVIITDGEQRAALAVVRSLGSSYRCIVASSSRSSLAGDSRFCARSVHVPDALSNPEAFGDAIVALTRMEGASLVIPIAEQSMLAILPRRDELAPAVVPFPELAAFRALTDKRQLLLEASKLGIAVPAQHVLLDAGAISSINADDLPYPIVLKPARSVGDHAGQRAKFSVTYALNAYELRRKIHQFPPAAFPLLLQQRVAGPGIGVFLLLWGGKQYAQFAHRRLCEKPASGGVSVYRESIAVDDSLVERSRALLERFNWRGVAMVEYKRDAFTGEVYLMEVNGRFWGSLQLAIDAGVDFPKLLAACAFDEAIEPQTSYRVGVRSRWWWGQVDHLIGRVRRRTAAALLSPETSSAHKVFGDLLFGPFRRRDYEEILWWNDPRPFLTETIRWMGAL